MKEKASFSKKILCIALCICLLCVLDAYRYYEEWPKRAVENAEKLIATVPTLREFVVNNQALIEDVRTIFSKYSLRSISNDENDINFVLDNTGERESLNSTSLLTLEEKEKISLLFSEKSPLVECDNIQFRLKQEYRDSGDGNCELRIMYVPDSEVENVSEFIYYMEEAVDEWYICVMINMSQRGISLDKYKNLREDKGLVRIATDSGTASVNHE